MIVYVDESYPDNQEKVILGALFLGINDHKILHNRIREIKRNSKFNGEIKYSGINDKTRYQIARRIIDSFNKVNNSYFRACIIPYSATKLENFTGQDTNQKRINIYTDSAKKLILGNLPKDTTSDIYFDEEERIKKTKLSSRLIKSKSVNGGRISSVYFTKSNDESRCVLQLCDLLTGAIKQNLYPTNTPKGKFKLKFSKYVLEKQKILNCSEDYWKKNTKTVNHKKHPKFFISYFVIPRQNSINQKNRS